MQPFDVTSIYIERYRTHDKQLILESIAIRYTLPQFGGSLRKVTEKFFVFVQQQTSFRNIYVFYSYQPVTL